MRLLLFGILLGVAASAGPNLTSLHLKNGRFQHLILSISESVAREIKFPEKAIAKLKHLLNAVSLRLDGSTGFQLGSISILVPPSWSPLSNGPIIGGESAQSSDIRVTLSTPSSSPTVVQPGGCGDQGAFISLPLEWLNELVMEDQIDAAVVDEMTQEFAHFRWGIFEETGCHSDPRYPPYFYAITDASNVHDVQLNTCSRKIIPGMFRDTSLKACDPGYTSMCSWVAGESPSFVQEQFTCNGILQGGEMGVRNDKAPTPQHLLCRGRTSKQVVKSHPDQKSKKLQPFTPPTISVAHRKTPLYLFVIDITLFVGERNTTNGLEIRGVLCTAFQRFIDTKPPNTYVEVYFFGTKVIHIPADPFYPCNFDPVIEATGLGRCIGCAAKTIQARISEFEGDMSVILVTGGPEKNSLSQFTPEQIEAAGIEWIAVEDFLNGNEPEVIPQRFLALSIDPSGLPSLHSLTSLWGGEVRTPSLEQGVPGLVTTLLSLVQRDDMTGTSEVQTLLYEVGSSFKMAEEWSFVVDPKTESLTIQIYSIFEDMEEFQRQQTMPNFILTDPNDNSSYAFTGAELLLYTGLRVGFLLQAPVAGKWSLTKDGTLLTKSTVTVHVNEMNPIYQILPRIDSSQSGILKISALVLAQDQSVKDTIVRISFLHSSGDVFSKTMLDDGRGTDFVPGDGIYSFEILESDLPSGIYNLIVQVNNVGLRGGVVKMIGSVPKSMGSLEHGCSIVAGFEKTTLPEFTRAVVTGDVEILNPPLPVDPTSIWCFITGHQSMTPDGYVVELMWALDEVQLKLVRKADVLCAEHAHVIEHVIKTGKDVPQEEPLYKISVKNPKGSNSIAFTFKHPSPTGVRFCALRLNEARVGSNIVALTHDVTNPGSFTPTTTAPPNLTTPVRILPPVRPREPPVEKRQQRKPEKNQQLNGFIRGYTDLNLAPLSIVLGTLGGMLICIVPLLAISIYKMAKGSGSSDDSTTTVSKNGDDNPVSDVGMGIVAPAAPPIRVEEEAIIMRTSGEIPRFDDQDQFPVEFEQGGRRKKRRRHHRTRGGRRHFLEAGDDDERPEPDDAELDDDDGRDYNPTHHDTKVKRRRRRIQRNQAGEDASPPGPEGEPQFGEGEQRRHHSRRRRKRREHGDLPPSGEGDQEWRTYQEGETGTHWETGDVEVPAWNPSSSDVHT